MTDIERDLHDMMHRTAESEPHVPRADRGLVRRARLRRARTAILAGAAIATLVIGGFAGARSLTNEEAVLPAEEDSSGGFAGTWITRDVDGRTRTMEIRESGEHSYDITVRNHLALLCSGAPSTLTGTGRLGTPTRLTFLSPEITCDDGGEPKVEGFPSVEEVFGTLTFEHDPESDTITNFSPLESRRTRGNGQIMYSGLTLVWNRAEAENRIGDVSGWITYGSKSGIWARDLSSPNDPSNRVRLSSAGTPIAWSSDGSKLLVLRDEKHSDPDTFSSNLFVVNSNGTETRLTDVNASVDGASFSPDGTAVVYASTRKCWDTASGCGEGIRWSTIYLMDAEGGSPRVLFAAEARRYPDPDKPGSYRQNFYGGDLFETSLQEPKWSPDGSQIAYFDGFGDWGHSLRVMNSDGTDSRVLVENEMTLGAGHVDGLEWSPDGGQLAFSIEGGVYVVGADGSGLRLVTGGERPYWSPDGSHIATTLGDTDSPEGGTLQIIELDDREVQNLGPGGSGPWVSTLQR